MTREAHLSTSSRRLVRAFLAWQAVVALATATVLLVLPPRFTAGQAMVTVYHLAPRAVWGLTFVVLAVAAGSVVIWLAPWRQFLVLLIAIQTVWALGLTLPLFYMSTTDLLTPLSWGSVAGSAFVIAHHVERP